MRKSRLFTWAVSAIILLASCEKNLYDPNQLPEKEQTVADLVIPKDFNWELSQQVACTIYAQQASAVSIYLDEAAPEETLAQLTARPGDEPIVVSIPTATQTLYLQYETAAGVKNSISAPIKADKTVAFTLPADSKPQSRTATRDGDNSILLTYPAAWGTILFEDMFPSIGDYDFNDFVAKYQIVLYGSGNNGHNIHNMRVSTYIYAVGGTTPFTPHFRLAGVDKSNIDLASVSLMGDIRNNPTPGIEIEVIDTDSKELVIAYKNATSNPHKKAGSPFLNTEPGYITKLSEVTQFTLQFNFKKPVNAKYLQESAIDLFLANKERSKEIHIKGFQPVFSKYTYAPGLDPETPYCSDRNLVWAVKVPNASLLRHAIEKANFLNAYTHFAEWATSGGKTYPNWYDRSKEGYSNKKLLVEWGK